MTAEASRGRTRAFRIIAFVFGLFVILPSAAFAGIALISSDPIEQSHRVHTIGGLWGIGLTGALLLAFAIRPSNLNAFQAGLVASIAMVVAGLVAGDLVTGFWYIGLIGTIVLYVLHPHRSEVLSFSGRPSVLLIGVGVIALFPAGAYALTMADLQGGPVTDPHVELHHWSGMAIAALSIVFVGIVAGLRTTGWRTTAWLAAGAGVLFALTSIVYPDHPGALEAPWGWLLVAWSVLYALAVLNARDESTA
jgi:hypothetical protein